MDEEAVVSLEWGWGWGWGWVGWGSKCMNSWCVRCEAGCSYGNGRQFQVLRLLRVRHHCNTYGCFHNPELAGKAEG